jgi:hypothetical protein
MHAFVVAGKIYRQQFDVVGFFAAFKSRQKNAICVSTELRLFAASRNLAGRPSRMRVT